MSEAWVFFVPKVQPYRSTTFSASIDAHMYSGEIVVHLGRKPMPIVGGKGILSRSGAGLPVGTTRT